MRILKFTSDAGPYDLNSLVGDIENSFLIRLGNINQLVALRMDGYATMEAPHLEIHLYDLADIQNVGIELLTYWPDPTIDQQLTDWLSAKGWTVET